MKLDVNDVDKNNDKQHITYNTRYILYIMLSQHHSTQ